MELTWPLLKHCLGHRRPVPKLYLLEQALRKNYHKLAQCENLVVNYNNLLQGVAEGKKREVGLRNISVAFFFF
jgi:hypothetical protein